MLQCKENVHWASLDASIYAPIDQGIVLLKSAQYAQDYKAFYDFILGDKAKAILKKYGYIVQ